MPEEGVLGIEPVVEIVVRVLTGLFGSCGVEAGVVVVVVVWVVDGTVLEARKHEAKIGRQQHVLVDRQNAVVTIRHKAVSHLSARIEAVATHTNCPPQRPVIVDSDGNRQCLSLDCHWSIQLSYLVNTQALLVLKVF